MTPQVQQLFSALCGMRRQRDCQREARDSHVDTVGTELLARIASVATQP
jgi:hypothetical protein